MAGEPATNTVIYRAIRLDAEREYMGRRGSFGVLETIVRHDGRRPRSEIVGVYADPGEAIDAAQQRQSARDQRETTRQR